MAALEEDFFVGDDLDAILALIKEDIRGENSDFLAEVDAVVGEINEATPHTGFPCEQCEKNCKSQRGLTRHRNVKHPQENIDNPAKPHKKTPEEIIHPLYFKKIVNNSASKLAQDECYSEKTRQEFECYTVSLDDADEVFKYFRDIVGEFKGNAEKFYPKFYKCVSDNLIFKNLSKRSSVLLGCEVANHVLAHLTGSVVKESSVELSSPSYTSKENNIIKYLSGYVFGTVYRRLRQSKVTQSMLGLQCLHLLIAGKKSVEDSSSDRDTILIRAKDRGGLWNVTPEVAGIFFHVETTFRQSTANVSKQIDSKKMVSQLMENASVLCNFNKLCSQSVEKVDKEIAFNLLDHLITLYIRVRTFSLVKDKYEQHKISSKRKKTKSLRTEIKKSSSALDQGH